jgi:hypothetical protein
MAACAVVNVALLPAVHVACGGVYSARHGTPELLLTAQVVNVVKKKTAEHAAAVKVRVLERAGRQVTTVLPGRLRF